MKKTPAGPGAGSPAGARLEPRTIPLEGGLARAVYALAAGFQFRMTDWPDPVDEEWPVYESGVLLARGIVDAALGVPAAPDDAALARAADAHAERVAELARERHPHPFSMDGYQPDDDALGLTSGALREQALEHHDAEILIGTLAGGEHVLVAGPVSVQQAHVWLLGPLYEKVEAWVEEDPVTLLERGASAWWFSRWRGPRPMKGDEFASGVREQEFTLVDRSLCITDESPVEHLVNEGLLRGIGPRQQHMAAQLIHSELGVWTVESRTEDRAVFVSPLDGTRYEVREHASIGDTGYGPGFIALGRLIPFGDGTWLRSPGTFLMSYGEPGAAMARTLAHGLQTQRGDLPLAAAVEFSMHRLTGVIKQPRAVPPAPTPDDAAEAGRTVTLLLREAGIARPIDPTSAQGARLAAQHPGTEILEYDVDVVLGEYMSALVQQGLKSKAVRDVKHRRARQARKKKGGRGRR
jgi:hypothetical protein